MMFKVVNNLYECERLWKKFWKGDSLFDDWEYRATFYNPEKHQLHFILGMDDGVEVGLLPLWQSPNYYEWFGGEFPENNQIPVVDDKYTEKFLEQVPENSWLPFMKETLGVPLSEEEGSFYIDLRTFDELDDYLAIFSKKHRKNLKRDLTTLKDVKIEHNNLDDVDRMAELNIAKFEDSFFADSTFLEGFRKLLVIAQNREELEMISLKIHDKTEAAEAAIFHKGVYTVLLGGSNHQISNIGKMLALAHIKNAISNKAQVIDFLAHDSGWKRLWNMEERKWYEYNK